ncbi:uncharacterized protein LAJ45_03684 [Morchella importuna]|uniref:uncharacterized protein n=1 Tax=Morchella importuna TaxID=1174673 RepID=UPI001E8E7F22|nr:uncharacterized protein LAJ45_03684 [Morchella importuna]KAH8152258.1 hypothetical protein LAJ45_03684 [Morchella importuna]
MTTVSYLGDFFSAYHSGTSSRESAEAARKGGFRDSIANLVGLGYVFAASGRSDIKALKRFGGTSDKPRVKTSHFVYEQERVLPFALHSQTNSTLETLFDPGVLAAIYRSAFKIHFAAMCRLEPSLVRRPSDDVSGIITSQSTVRVFKTNRRWCRGTQAGLFTAAIPAIFMLLLGKDRRCYLDGEPNSLASALGILDRGSELTSHLERSEFQRMRIVRSILKHGMARYRLVLEPNIGPRIEVTYPTGAPLVSLPVLDKPEPRCPEVWPITFYSGLFFCDFLRLNDSSGFGTVWQ